MSEMKDYAAVTDYDRTYYQRNLRNFLPDRIIDCHAHIWLEEFKSDLRMPVRAPLWPVMVAPENSVEQMMDIYKSMFPDKSVTPVVFGCAYNDYDMNICNRYVEKQAETFHFPSLMLAAPSMKPGWLERKVKEGGFHGIKVYLSQAPSYISENEIRIYDFLPPEQLKLANRHGWTVMLHIARPNRIKDPVNLGQLMEIDKKYPNAHIIVAHIGRAYVNEDLGNAFDVLRYSRNLLFDFSANTNEYVMARLIETAGPDRILFGSDMPLAKMRMRRITDDGIYVNLVPKGAYGDVSSDRHMREIGDDEAVKLTYFLYEEINAFRLASQETGLTKTEIEKIFYGNAARIMGIHE